MEDTMDNKITVFMYYWFTADEFKKLQLPSWFKDRETAEITWDQLRELYDTGASIALKHTKNGSTLGISLTGFYQR